VPWLVLHHAHDESRRHWGLQCGVCGTSIYIVTLIYTNYKSIYMDSVVAALVVNMA